jgi:pilus assembly protein FimV
MLRLSGYKLLLLGLVLPGASFALGLGDIHVESTLHQPLAAEIEIVGATPENSAGLTATIADEEMFQRHGLERAAVLSSTALTVRQDRQGRPVLVLRSTDTFTEPMVTLLVDLHSPNGEFIREYTILLDPPGLAPVESASTAPEHHAAAQDLRPATDTYTVAPRDTLDRIARIAGAHSRSERRKMMIAIFRANRGAFQTNLNNLRSGVNLHLPSVAELSKISADEANREFAAQMKAWRAPDHRLPPAVAAVPTPVAAATAPAIPTTPVADTKSDRETREAETSALSQRVEALEKSLDELKQHLKQPPVAQTTAPIVAAAAPGPTGAAAQLQPDEEEPVPVSHHRIRFVPLVAALGLALATGVVWLYLRRRNDEDNVTEAHVEQDSSTRRDSSDHRSVEPSKNSLLFPKIDISASYLVEEAKSEAEYARRPSTTAALGDSAALKEPVSTPSSAITTNEPTVKLATPHILDAETTAILELHANLNDDTAAREFAFFNPEGAHNTTHVMVAGELEEPAPFVERRKNPADVLRQAIEREPDRNDLRLKLLELYYTAAAQNRRAFLDAVRQLAKNEKFASPNEWSLIEDMGRAIAPDDELFSNGRDKKAVA